MIAREELPAEQAAAVDELERVIGEFALALNRCREAELGIVDSFRLAGVEIPSWVPAGLIEGMLAPA